LSVVQVRRRQNKAQPGRAGRLQTGGETEVARPNANVSVKRRSPTALRGATTRERLLDAAVIVLKRRGYLGFATVEAAEVAGVTRGAPNYHFKSTEAFLFSTLEHLFKMYLGGSQKSLENISTTEDILIAIVEDALRAYMGEDFVAILDVVISASKNPSGRKKLQEFSNRLRRPVETMWRDELVKRGFELNAAEGAVLVLHSIARGVAVRSLLSSDRARHTHTLEVGKAAVRGMLAGHAIKVPNL
jgi:AcrR family transcriptional regulator